MISKFQHYHIINFLEALNDTPLDVQLSRYLRQHKSIGSKDRKTIGDTIYDLIRWLGWIDPQLEKVTWERRLNLFLTTEEAIKPLEPHQIVSFPKPFYHALIPYLGKEQTDAFCLHSNLAAPLTIRTNLLKINRKDLLEKLKSKCPVSPCKESLSGITVHKKINFFELPEFKEGLFEVQDEASQLVADCIEANPGDEVLDFCAGAGGKTLAFAHRLKGKGQLFLFDIRKKALQNAKQRLHRAGIQNAQTLPELPKSLKNRMNWLLLDVPCSGSGTWRRNPDQKWKFSEPLLSRIVEEQRQIFENALPFLHPKGTLVYATCSVLPQENEEQIAYFTKKYGLLVKKPFFKSLPSIGEKDGFFAAVMAYSTL